MEKRISEILAKHQLRKTTARMQVLECFLHSDSAISHSRLEKKLADTDRITLYRTLKTFEETGIIHKAMDGTGIARYALCAGSCQHHHHEDNHAHFHCGECGNTVCLDEVVVPAIQLPTGFQQDSSHLIIKGTCEKCK